MLFKQKTLEGIKAGNISLAFRKWKKSAAKAGGKMKTALGIIEILDVVEVNEKDLKSADALNSGFTNLEELLVTLREIKEGTIYKIKLRYSSVDPRIELRKNDAITQAEFEKTHNKLKSLDKHSKQGSWTLEILNAIQSNPHLRAADLSKIVNHEKDWLKINIRKLKNLGLTISHEVGYELSPRGKAFLKLIKKL